MKKNFKKATILAVIGAAMALQGAQAQIVVNNGDLIFGAETVNGGTAAGSNLEVDLGSITQFTTTATLSFANVSATDLASLFNAGASTGNYATANNVFWSVVGTTNTSDVPTGTGGNYFQGAAFLTLKNDPGVQSATTLSTTALGAASIYNGLAANIPAPTAAPHSNGTGGELAVSNTNSYSANEGTAAGGTTFFNFSGGGSTTFSSGESLNLYALNTAGDGRSFPSSQTGTDVLLGSFSFSPTGGLTFTGADAGTAAVPEPSTYALMFAGLAVLFFLGRRRSLKS